jgi:hypothetical protein
MDRLTIAAFFGLLVNLGIAQSVPPNHAYLNQPLPGNTPKKFELATTPGYFAAERICLSDDGSELYYTELNGYNPTSKGRTKYYQFEHDHWTGPFVLFETFGAPILSPSGDKMYLEKNFDTYCSERTRSGWSEPKRLQHGAHYFQEIKDGKCYLSSSQAEGSIGKFDWSELSTNGSATNIRSLGAPLNSPDKNLDFYIAKDASYIVFAHFAGNLLISYKKPDNTWTNPKTLIALPGNYVWGPSISNDGQFLFFTGGDAEANTCTYWVKIDAEIEKLKHTNFEPYVKHKPTHQTASSHALFRFVIPGDTFVDDDGNQTLRYSASLKQGNPLPSWLTFDASTRTLSGTPPEAGALTVRITATDSAQASAACQFDLRTDLPAQASKPVVTKPSDIPDHAYVIQGKPSDVLQNHASLLNLAQQLEKDKQADLEKYDIQDSASFASLHNSLYVVALLKKDFAAAHQHLEQVWGFQENPIRKLMTGLLTSPYIQAMEQPGADFHATFRALLSKQLAALPAKDVQGNLKARLESMKTLSRAQIIGAIEANGDSMVKDGKLSEELAEALLSTAINLEVVLPVKADVVACLEGWFQTQQAAQ